MKLSNVSHGIASNDELNAAEIAAMAARDSAYVAQMEADEKGAIDFLSYVASFAASFAVVESAYIYTTPEDAKGAWKSVKDTCDWAASARFPGEYADPAEEENAQSILLRDIFGNPFRPIAPDPAWRTPTVDALAMAAYEERLLPDGTLDADRLAVLADALEDAGCDNVDILSHLRGPGPHVRGCWPVDLILGRE